MSTKAFLPVIRSFNQGLALHAATVQWTYTVPAGRRAELEYFHNAILQLAAAAVAVASGEVKINGTNISFVANTGVIGTLDALTYGNRITLDSGDVLNYTTTNTVAVAQAFRGFAVIREYQ